MIARSLCGHFTSACRSVDQLKNRRIAKRADIKEYKERKLVGKNEKECKLDRKKIKRANSTNKESGGAPGLAFSPIPDFSIFGGFSSRRLLLNRIMNYRSFINNYQDNQPTSDYYQEEESEYHDFYKAKDRMNLSYDEGESTKLKELNRIAFETISSIQFCIDGAIGLPVSATATRVTARLLAGDRSQVGDSTSPNFCDPDSDVVNPQFDLQMIWKGKTKIF
jgi:hypothetical protein